MILTNVTWWLSSFIRPSIRCRRVSNKEILRSQSYVVVVLLVRLGNFGESLNSYFDFAGRRGSNLMKAEVGPVTGRSSSQMPKSRDNSCWGRPLKSRLCVWLAVLYHLKTRVRSICIRTVARKFLENGVWRSKIWHKLHWLILFHISIWGSWSFVLAG